MKRILQGIVTLTLCFMLIGCGHKHTWVDATCSEAKHCSECGETEGEPLNHTWVEASCSEAKHCSICGKTEGEPLQHTLTEATYQKPAICTVCGSTVGDPLQPDFEKYGLKCNAEVNVEYPYITNCQKDTSKATTGKVSFTDYKVFTSDDTHEALDGYEWRTVTAIASFDDDNAKNFLPLACIKSSDYYDIITCDSQEDFYPIIYNGKNYDVYSEASILSYGWDKNGVYTFKVRAFYRVPIGYDGAVIAWYSSANKNNGTYSYEKFDDNSVIFRLK